MKVYPPPIAVAASAPSASLAGAPSAPIFCCSDTICGGKECKCSGKQVGTAVRGRMIVACPSVSDAHSMLQVSAKELQRVCLAIYNMLEPMQQAMHRDTQGSVLQ